MANNDIRVISSDYTVRTFPVDDRTTSGTGATFKPGEPIKKGGASTNFVVLLATGEPTQTSAVFIGIVSRESTETSSAEGYVEAKVVKGGTELEGLASTAANFDTQSEIDDLIGHGILFDYDGTNFTIDENDTDDLDVNGLVIVGGDPVKSIVYVQVHAGVTLSGTRTTVSQ